MLKEIPEIYMQEFEPSNKLGLISTIDPEGCPHISLITSIQANGKKEIIWGEFIEGMSKKNVLSNPKTGFLIMSMDQHLWRGRASWARKVKEGPEYQMYNQKPLYRYNSYCGISTVHYMGLVDITDKVKLNTGAIAYGAVLTKLAKSKFARKDSSRVLKPFGENLFNKMDSLKFLSYIDEEGFPVIVPIIQAQAAGSGRIAFSTTPFKDEIMKIPEGAKAAVFGMTLDMEDVLVKGTFQGLKKSGLISTGIFDIEKVYNSMPPVPGYIYPEHKLEAVTEF